MNIEGYYIKFKNVEKEKIYYGEVLEVSRTGFIGVKVEHLDFPPGFTVFIDKRQIIQAYSPKLVEHLTPRLALKHLWRDLIFREVKVTKCSNLLYVDYRYIGKTGFEKVKRFRSLEQAYSNISSEYHDNIIPCYGDFFGFTTDKAIRNNDYYYDKEIFFSKKCYCELDWSSKPTGDFMTTERAFNNESPLPDALVCGIVENGEKGLFFRKWFICSTEFLTLWTMVCDPNDSSLCENMDPERSIWNKIERPKKRVKDLNKLIKELDTSFYSINLKLDLNERRKKYLSYNLERTALYFPNRYKQIAEVLFSKGFLKNEDSFSEDYNDVEIQYTKFQKKLIKNIMWPKILFLKN